MYLNSRSSRSYSLIRWLSSAVTSKVDIKFSGFDVLDGFDGFRRSFGFCTFNSLVFELLLEGL